MAKSRASGRRAGSKARAFNDLLFAIGFLQQDFGAMITSSRTTILPRILLAALIIIAIAVLRAEVIAQTCNPAIDGTYCAEQMSKRPSSRASTPRSNPNVGGDFFSLVRDNNPATFGAITFGGGTKCIGILRRSSCN